VSEVWWSVNCTPVLVSWGVATVDLIFWFKLEYGEGDKYDSDVSDGLE
jgi:hypothetical protein